MGKGGGCVPSKKRKPVGVSDREIPNPLSDSPLVLPKSETIISLEANSARTVEPTKRRPLRIFIVFYSMYGHVETLAKKVKEGVDAVDGVEGVLFRVPETLPSEVLNQMRVTGKNTDVLPEIKPDEIVKADGLLFGFPTRFGSMAAQMKTFFDSTYELWRDQRLAGVPAGFFVSTGTQGGGQETTAWTAVTQLAHHGMIYVPIGYTFGAGMFDMESLRGGSPYGAGVLSGDGSRKPTETEVALAKHQGMYMASIVKKLGGRSHH